MSFVRALGWDLGAENAVLVSDNRLTHDGDVPINKQLENQAVAAS